jgi:hypothetical protein
MRVTAISPPRSSNFESVADPGPSLSPEHLKSDSTMLGMAERARSNVGIAVVVVIAVALLGLGGVWLNGLPQRAFDSRRKAEAACLARFGFVASDPKNPITSAGEQPDDRRQGFVDAFVRCMHFPVAGTSLESDMRAATAADAAQQRVLDASHGISSG